MIRRRSALCSEKTEFISLGYEKTNKIGPDFALELRNDLDDGQCRLAPTHSHKVLFGQRCFTPEKRNLSYLGVVLLQLLQGCYVRTNKIGLDFALELPTMVNVA